MAFVDKFKELKSITDQLKVDFNTFNNELKSTESIVNGTLSPFESLLDTAQKLSQHKSKENQLSADGLKTLRENVAIQQKVLKSSQISLQDRLKHLQTLKTERESILETSTLSAKKRKEEEKALEKITNEINANKRAQSDLAEQIQSTTEEAKKLSQALKHAEGMAEIGAKMSSGFKKVDGAAKSASETIIGAFGISSLNPLQLLLDLFGFSVAKVIELDKETGDAAKSMNQTYSEANKSRQAMVSLAEASGDLLVNSTQIQKTYLELNKTLGTSVAFEKMGKSLQEDIAFMGMLEESAGLTAEESNSILKYSLQLGKSAKTTSGILMAQYKASSLKYGIVVNEKDALKEIGKLSESIKISTAGGAAGLAKALAAAKGLGSNLNDVENAAGGLLNFEESIEKELTAELLTGKQLNLEKARQAALNNDLATVAEEIKNQVGSAAEFAEMNRLAQESVAAAVGMTREQLAGALATQEQQKEISKEALSTEESAYNALVAKHGEEGAIGIMMQQQIDLQRQQLSSQEKLQRFKDKEKDSIANGILPLMNQFNKQIEELLKKAKLFLDKLGGWKSLLIVIGGIIALNVIGNLVKAGAEMIKMIGVLKKMKIAQSISAGIEIVKGAFTMSAPLGPAGIPLVPIITAAGMGALATAMMMSDGIISPTSGGNGFGDRVLYGPEGAISFNNKDTIVAGTDLFAKKTNDYMSPPGGITIDNKPQTEKSSNSNELKQLREDIQILGNNILSLASRPINVAVEGETIIKAAVGNDPNSTGLNMAKNSFSTQ